MEVFLTEADLELFKVTKGTGLTPNAAKKLVLIFSMFGMIIKDVVAEAVAPNAGGSVFVKVADLLEAGMDPNQDMRISLCSQECPVIDDGRGFVEVKGAMTGITLLTMVKQAKRLNNPLEPIMEIAKQYVLSLPEVPGVTRPTVEQVVFGTPALLDHANSYAKTVLATAAL